MKVYIILSKTGTILSHMIQAATGEPTPHCSLSLDRELYRMYSFGRRNAYDLFNAGLVHERPDKNVFGRLTNTKCTIYELEVTPHQFLIIRNTMKEFWKNKEKYHFNFPGIIFAWVKYYPLIPDSFYCSQYVAYVLQKAGISFSDKNFLAVRSEDFRNSPLVKEIYRGKLQDYWKSVKRADD